MGRSICSLGMQPPEGPPVWTALNALPPGNPAADVVDDLAEGDPHRDFDEAGVVDLADEREDLGPLARLRSDPGEPLAPPVDDDRDVGPGLDVVDAGRLAPQAALGGIGRPRPRLAQAAFDRGDQRRLLAADEGAGPALDLDVEVEAACPGCPAPRSPYSRACSRARAEPLRRPGGTRSGRRRIPPSRRSPWPR